MELFVATQAPTAVADPTPSPLSECYLTCSQDAVDPDTLPTCMSGCDTSLLKGVLMQVENTTSLGEICQAFSPLFASGCLEPCTDTPDAAEALYIFKQCESGASYMPPRTLARACVACAAVQRCELYDMSPRLRRGYLRAGYTASASSFYGLALSDSDSNSDSELPSCLLGCDAQLLASLMEIDDAIESQTICPSIEPLFQSGCMDACPGSPDEAVLLPILTRCGLGACAAPARDELERARWRPAWDGPRCFTRIAVGEVLRAWVGRAVGSDSDDDCFQQCRVALDTDTDAARRRLLVHEPANECGCTCDSEAGGSDAPYAGGGQLFYGLSLSSSDSDANVDTDSDSDCRAFCQDYCSLTPGAWMRSHDVP